MLHRLLSLFSAADWSALALFLCGWIGYGYFADHAPRSISGLRGVTHRHREAWGREMAFRENRIVDASLIGNLMNSVSFYANTTIYIIAGLMAIAGTLDRLVTFAEDLPFARETTRQILEAKLFLLIGVFVFAYFKFTWSLRQFNFLSILVGSTPAHDRSDAVLQAQAERFAILNTLAGDEFNGGIRAYYFGFAALAWFAHPGLFAAMTVAILLILYRRDFRSKTRRALDMSR
jgi:uncharacterized membrane protein